MIVKHYKHHLAVNRHFVTEKYAKKKHIINSKELSSLKKVNNN